MDIQEKQRGRQESDDAGLIGVEANEGGLHAKELPKERTTYDTMPAFVAPHSKRNGPQSWTSCRRCLVWYAAPASTLRTGGAVYCSSRCAYAHATETGKFKGERNPNWLGGVSNDNMRYRRRQIEREPVQVAARSAVSNAVRSGALVRLPCEVCGAVKSEGHHDDYSKPLSVRWLCRRHHVEHHNSKRATP